MQQKLSINKNNKLPFSTHDRVLILTDLEPDDVLAIRLLRKIIPDAVPILVVVGESNMDKTSLAYNIFNKYGYSNINVIRGKSSNKEYPKDALYSFEESNDKDVNVVNADNALVAASHITKFLGITDTEICPLIIAIKPLWELLYIDKNILLKCVMLLYGSFNIRAMRGGGSDKLFEFLNNQFKYVIMYESFFATKEMNSINNANAPILFANLDVELTKMIIAWNKHILKECLTTITELAIRMSANLNQMDLLVKDHDRLVNRNLKIVTNIIDAQGMQMVLADSGLIAYVFNNMQSGTIQRGSISVDTLGYTKMTQSEDNLSKIYLITDVDAFELIKGIENLM